MRQVILSHYFPQIYRVGHFAVVIIRRRCRQFPLQLPQFTYELILRVIVAIAALDAGFAAHRCGAHRTTNRSRRINTATRPAGESVQAAASARDWWRVPQLVPDETT